NPGILDRRSEKGAYRCAAAVGAEVYRPRYVCQRHRGHFASLARIYRRCERSSGSASIETLHQTPLSQKIAHNFAVHVSQAVVAALEAVDELGVVETEDVHDRGLQVMDVHLVTRDREAELVGGAVRVAAFDAAACEPHRETIGVMVTAER